MKKNLLVVLSLIVVSTLIHADETVTDVCGNTYPIVTIGTQTWMAENLRCNKYDTESEAYNASWLTNNIIYPSNKNAYTPYYTNASDTTKWDSTAEYVSNLSREQITKLGYLYNWAAAVGIENGYDYGTTSFANNRQGICPNGWYVPSDADWRTLYDYIYKAQNLISNQVSKFLKTKSGWYNNANGTDDYGFAALPSAATYRSGIYVGEHTRFWSATPEESNSDLTNIREIYYFNDELEPNNFTKSDICSVRCIKSLDVEAFPKTKIVSWQGEMFEISIDSNTSWIATVNKNWASISPLSGSGKEMISVNVTECEGIAMYDTAYISVKSITGDETVVRIYRMGKPVPEKCNESDYIKVTIGTQTWMAENYHCSKYDTESEAYNASWLTDNTVPTSCKSVFSPYFTDASNKTNWYMTSEYSNNLNNEQISKLGYLYNWAAAVGIAQGDEQISSFTGTRQGICPNGWHIPSNVDWQTLYDYIYKAHNLDSSQVGTYLKATSGWYNNGNGLDSYGFTALPSGNAYGCVVFPVGLNAYFWTDSPDKNDNNNANKWFLVCGDDYLDTDSEGKKYCRSVRCIKD